MRRPGPTAIDGVIAPPTMLQAWIMRGLRASWLADEARAAGDDPANGAHDSMMHLLDLEGLTSVVATNCEQSYGRPLVLGDRLLVRSVIEDISDPKRTGLGHGSLLHLPPRFHRGARRRRPRGPQPRGGRGLGRTR